MNPLEQLQADAIAQIHGADSLATLEQTRVALVGKKGKVSQEMQKLGQLSPEERKTHGQLVNAVKQAVQQALEAQKERLEAAELAQKLTAEAVDVTLPAARWQSGRQHPVTAVMDEIAAVLSKQGFSYATGPQLETDFYNFTALNIPPEHPARQDHDTFYITLPDGTRKVLRTQTSNAQIHTMEAFAPPLRVMCPGKVFRRDYDATHTPQFHQVEGLAVEKGLHFGHLKGILQQFLNDFFEEKRPMRLRPHYFPFTEPSAEVDMGCPFCNQKGCRVCKHTGWLEVLGAGMVHRNVLKQGGIDHHVYAGLAFGCGIERLAMLKYGIDDLRLFYETHAQFLQHFGKSIGQTAV